MGLVSSNKSNFTLSLSGNVKFAEDSLFDVTHIDNMNLNATNWWTTYSLGNI